MMDEDPRRPSRRPVVLELPHPATRVHGTDGLGDLGRQPNRIHWRRCPTQFVAMLPYLATIAVLIAVQIRPRPAQRLRGASEDGTTQAE